MSSITFPLGHQSSEPSSSDHDTHGFYPPPSFDGNSSFQMNPLSSHPPRTPRASLIVTHSQVYGTDIYEDAEGKREQSIDVEEEIDDEAVNVQHQVRKEDIWREIILTSTGRDKAFVSRPKHVELNIFTHHILETDTILHPCLSFFPFLGDHEFTFADSHPSAMGKRTHQATHSNNEWTFLHKVVLGL